jgi:hypothetical protein
MRAALGAAIAIALLGAAGPAVAQVNTPGSIENLYASCLAYKRPPSLAHPGASYYIEPYGACALVEKNYFAVHPPTPLVPASPQQPDVALQNALRQIQ